jgi:DNA-directed RNA polymerase specialized sigma24 family protein
MSALNLRALQQGDPDAWNEAHHCLWPTALAVARLKLEPFLPADIEDVALEALEELVEKVHGIESVDELKPLTASICHNRAVSRLREHFAKKRGAGQIESLEARQRAEADCPDSIALDSPLVRIIERIERAFAMSVMNDQRFFDLAMKVIAHQATDAERADLDSVVASDLRLKAESERLRAESTVFKEVLPLMEATGAKDCELPGYARGRLQAKVAQTFRNTGVTEREERKTLFAGWRLWAFGLAATTALLAVLLVPVFTKPSAPVVQVAVLDLAGPTRGEDNPELRTLKEMWKE